MSRILTYKEALNEALKEEMQRDDRVFAVGLCGAERGSSFGVTKGLLEIFGPDRIIDMPISESSFTGMGVGAAMQGKRPVVEIMSIDFATLGLDMMLNQAAKYHFITGDVQRVPMVLRTQGGSGKSVAVQHSQSLEALFYHVPGLKVFMPSTPYDAKGLLKAAIRDDDPVVFIEHKLLYSTTGEVPEEEYIVEPGKASLRHEGADCTVVSWSHMAGKCAEAVDTLAREGIECDFLDLRTLVPMDRTALAASVKKTGRLVVVTEAVKRGSVASDVAAWVAEYCFESLKSPIVRVAGRPTPIPYNSRIERACVPQIEDIVAAVRACVKK